MAWCIYQPYEGTMMDLEQECVIDLVTERSPIHFVAGSKCIQRCGTCCGIGPHCMSELAYRAHRAPPKSPTTTTRLTRRGSRTRY